MRQVPVESGGLLSLTAQCANDLDNRPALKLVVRSVASDGGPMPFTDSALNRGDPVMMFGYGPEGKPHRQALASLRPFNVFTMVFGVSCSR